MNRSAHFALLTPVLLVVLAGCGATQNAEACDEIERAVGKSVVTLTDVVAEPLSAKTLEAAAAEVETYLEPLRNVQASGELEQPHAAVLTSMDEMLIAVRAGDVDRIGDVTNDLTKIAVDVKLACD